MLVQTFENAPRRSKNVPKLHEKLQTPPKRLRLGSDSFQAFPKSISYLQSNMDP